MISPNTNELESPGCEPREAPWGNYFVAAYPPFGYWTPDQVDEALCVLDSTPSEPAPPLGIYVHIPFCVKRCDYCYYRSSAGASAAQIDDYLDTLAQEIALYVNSPALADRAPTFAYFGGGTPSMLSEHALAKLVADLSKIDGWDQLTEVTFECAPISTTEGKLDILRDNGVTRVSMGVQSMDDDVLQRNGRVHLTRDVIRAYEMIRQRNFDIVNLDLIAGLLGETDDSFLASLDRIIALEPESVTVYQLEIPTNTPLFRSLQENGGDTATASWETKRRRQGEAFARLESSGYHVRSAYAAVRDPIRHRFLYQELQYRGADLIGLGLSSFSYVGGTHYQNDSVRADYASKTRAGIRPIQRACTLTSEERAIREFVLQLKLGSIDTQYFADKFNIDVVASFRNPLAALQEAGLLTLTPDRIELTREGLLQADALVSRFYAPCHWATFPS